MQVTNSFWREILDYLPDVIMLFRIDEQEQAQLMFVNEAISEELGYKPEEFILASENTSHVQTQLEWLVDDIARRTHESDKKDQNCFFYSKEGEEIHFSYDFKLIKIKSSRSPFIAVTFYNKELSIPTRKTEKNISKKIISESPLMKSVVNQLATQQKIKTNVLIRGEQFVGKSTLAHSFLKKISLDGYVVYEIDTRKEANEVVEAIKELKALPKSSDKAALSLLHIQNLNSEAQQILQGVLEHLISEDFDIRIVATTSASLENLMETGRFNSELYYLLGFQQVLVPPLRKRPEDVLHYVKNIFPALIKPLGISELHITDDIAYKYANHQLSDNWVELKRLLRKALTNLDEGSNLEFISEDNDKKGSQTSLFPGEETSIDEIIPFDEMNKKYLESVLKATRGKIYGDDGAAALLNLKPTTLQSKLKKLHLR